MRPAAHTFIQRLLPGAAPIWLGFYGMILGSWAILFLSVRASDVANLPGGMPTDFWQSLCLTAAEAGFGALFLMWALMSSAMMLPGFVPMLRTYTELFATGATDRTGAAALVGGYLIIWLVASAGGALLQGWFARAALIGPDGATISPWLTAGLLALAGTYQLSPMKEACLSRCRMPIGYFMERWRPGVQPAFNMGLELGVICFGCCWALMMLAFVGGTMNLIWMGAATLFMSLEKLPEIGRPLTRPAGILLIGAALLVAATAFPT